MIPLDLYHTPSLVKNQLDAIHSLHVSHPVRIMEVCGTHTMQIAKYGFRKLLPKNIHLISGPGCPICVTPTSFTDRAILLSRHPDVLIATFGDVFRVRGSEGSLENEKSRGAHIEILYSPMELLELCQRYPAKMVIFLSIGFETTMPAIAFTLREAKKMKIHNLRILPGNKFFLPAMEALLKTLQTSQTHSLHGLLLPGHLSLVTGWAPYPSLLEHYKLRGVVTGFDPLDITRGIHRLLSLLLENSDYFDNQYKRAVHQSGNPEALACMNEIFQPVEDEWRGLGRIPLSGAALTENYQTFDVTNFFTFPEETSREIPGCRCPDVLLGRISPGDCPLMGKVCTPKTPQGACMVSQEGTCAAWYQYER